MSIFMASPSSGTISGHTLPSLFEAQVSSNPDAIAVIHAGRKLTYGELDERVNSSPTISSGGAPTPAS